ncbi:phospholipid:lipid A palmitoyltransferase [Campylobacter sp. MIT 19-121]|uniref:phospholipid:lipid A palmitoyltransferase n=1 Tax=Campylobacter sp. MIT 19-121 TaxID=2703906 RepID=UPI001389741F|nr:phospholipid:lipid A palmitoyltransferase [Campylobacter sp. MIT 19-121]
MRKIFLFVLLLSSIFADEDFLTTLKKEFIKAKDEGKPALIIPINTWHNRWFYDDEHLSRYNEKPLGLGFAQWISEEKINYGLFGIVFNDSNYHIQTMFGYIKHYHLNDDAVKFSLGYIVGLTQRKEYWYIPIPLPLPSASLSYKKLAVQFAYVPGVKNNGNVLFSWISWTF